jgi:hypothetical protein
VLYKKAGDPQRPPTLGRSYITSAFAGALFLSFATAALAASGEYGNMCSMGLALGKDIQTDCSINSQLQGKTYCFGSKEAMAVATSKALRPPEEGLYASNEW